MNPTKTALIGLILLSSIVGLSAQDSQIAPAQQAPAGRILPAGTKTSVDTSWIQKKHQDLPYATQSAAQKLDLYIPNEGTGPFPLIIEIHGGGFATGSKPSQIGPMLEAVKKGYALASINYRLSGEANWPAQINDVKAASSAESKYLGKTIGTVEAQPLVEAASPRTYISQDDPSFFIQHGTADRNIPITQSVDFARSLAQVIGSGKVVYEALEGAGHGGSQFETAANTAKVIDFLGKVLR